MTSLQVPKATLLFSYSYNNVATYILSKSVFDRFKKRAICTTFGRNQLRKKGDVLLTYAPPVKHCREAITCI